METFRKSKIAVVTTNLKRRSSLIYLLTLAVGIYSYPCVIAAGGSTTVGFALAAKADAAPAEKPAEAGGEKAPAKKTEEPPKAPEKAPETVSPKMPFKTFVPSEKIEPDHAVDFPADI